LRGSYQLALILLRDRRGADAHDSRGGQYSEPSSCRTGYIRLCLHVFLHESMLNCASRDETAAGQTGLQRGRNAYS